MPADVPEQLREIEGFPGVRIWSERQLGEALVWRIGANDIALAQLSEMMGVPPCLVLEEIGLRATHRLPILTGGDLKGRKGRS